VNLDSRVTGDYFESRLDVRFADQNARIDARLAEQDARFARLEAKVDSNHRIVLWSQAIVMAAVIILYLERLLSL
jgi:hypothetical protein